MKHILETIVENQHHYEKVQQTPKKSIGLIRKLYNRFKARENSWTFTIGWKKNSLFAVIG